MFLCRSRSGISNYVFSFGSGTAEIQVTDFSVCESRTAELRDIVYSLCRSETAELQVILNLLYGSGTA